MSSKKMPYIVGSIRTVGPAMSTVIVCCACTANEAASASKKRSRFIGNRNYSSTENL